MKVFSTYYDKVPELNQKEYTLVRVSRAEPPDWFVEKFDCVDLSDAFGPTHAMLHECHPAKDWEAFAPRYKKEILSVLDATATLKLLEKIYIDHGCKPLLLLCYEAPPENCHRQLIGEFLGIHVEEL